MQPVGNDDTVLGKAQLFLRLLQPFQIVIPSGEVAGRNGGAQGCGRLEPASAIGVDALAVPGQREELQRPRLSQSRAGKDQTPNNAERQKQPIDRCRREGHRRRRHGSTAAELAGKTDDTGPGRSPHRCRRRRAIVGDEGMRRAHRPHQRDRPFEADGVGLTLDQRAGEVRHRRAARMQVEHDVMAREEFVFEEMRQARRRRPRGIAGKGPVEVAAVEGRAAFGRHHRRQVRHRQDGDGAVNLSDIKQAHQPAELQFALIFVTVVAGHQQQRRPFAISEAKDRNADLIIGRTVDRIGNGEMTGLPALTRKVDRIDEAAMHGPSSAGRCRAVTAPRPRSFRRAGPGRPGALRCRRGLAGFRCRSSCHKRRSSPRNR
ncbi:hypothetical protein RHECNPAF_1360056 [Rhizobium etli CNPAF512]|nr:hypothetical protein RHECNPAF_1360056 [Rhizobium etli CNPAF512]